MNRDKDGTNILCGKVTRTQKTMVKLTSEIMKIALSENDVPHGSRAKVAELLNLYNALPLDVRRAFEEANELNVNVEQQVTIEDVDDTAESDETAENEVDGNIGLPENNADADARKRQEEILALRERIRAMKKRARADARAAEVQRMENVASAQQAGPAAVAETNTAVEGQMGPRPMMELQVGLRTAPYPDTRAAVALPNNAAPVSYRDLEQSIVKLNGEESTIDVKSFLTQFEEMMTLVNADEVFKLLALRQSLKGAAEKLLTHPQSMAYGDLRALLEREFDGRNTPADVEAEIANMQLTNQDESLFRGIHTISELKNRCLRYRVRLQEEAIRRPNPQSQPTSTRESGAATSEPRCRFNCRPLAIHHVCDATIAMGSATTKVIAKWN